MSSNWGPTSKSSRALTVSWWCFVPQRRVRFFILTNSFSGFIQSVSNTRQLETLFSAFTMNQFLYCLCCQLQLSDPGLISGHTGGAAGFFFRPRVLKMEAGSLLWYAQITPGRVSCEMNYFVKRRKTKVKRNLKEVSNMNFEFGYVRQSKKSVL